MEIKICCISSVDEAHLAIDAGATALGLVSMMPSGPGIIDEELIRTIAASVTGQAETFLLTSLREPDAIIQQHRRCQTTAIQVCDALPEGSHTLLREAIPKVRLVQVVHVIGEESYREAMTAAQSADTLLLDSGNPTLAVKELGGTGRAHDWTVSKRIRENAPVPLFLAGGLREDNVAQALEQVRPSGLDICSGVRANGRLDAEKLRRFIATVQSVG